MVKIMKACDAENDVCHSGTCDYFQTGYNINYSIVFEKQTELTLTMIIRGQYYLTYRCCLYQSRSSVLISLIDEQVRIIQ